MLYWSVYYYKHELELEIPGDKEIRADSAYQSC